MTHYLGILKINYVKLVNSNSIFYKFKPAGKFKVGYTHIQYTLSLNLFEPGF